jgi:hypothetical protein
MQDDDRLTSMEKELEAALGGLKPSGAGISRDRVMFAAGQASVRRRGHVWQGVSAALVVLLLVSLAWRPGPTGPQPSLETVAHKPPAISTTLTSREAIDQRGVEAFRRYVRTRRAVLTHGIEVLPVAPASHDGHDAPLTDDDLDDLLS